MITVSLALAALSGCGKGNGAATPMVDANGKHAQNWVQQHWVFYKEANGGSREVSAATGCSQCHGADLAGGISKVSCFSATFNGTFCHANDDHTLGHPKSWGDPTSGSFHAAATFNGAAVRGSGNLAAACGLCHATESNVPRVGSAPSCLSTDPKWGISCHATSPALQSSGCVSCHGTPPGGGASPNRAGAHAKHIALAGVGCGTCHAGTGTGTGSHATGNGSAFVSLAAAYRAKTGTFSYTQGRCAAVICHGGKQSPVWAGGALNIASDCLNCHEQGLTAQSPQFNSFFSGDILDASEHQAHLAKIAPGTGRLIFCTDCHDPGKLNGDRHFGGLTTPAFEGAPGDTLVGPSTRINSYDKTTTNCNNSCHTDAPNPVRWRR